MVPPAGRKLTRRQFAVLERIDRRVPIKVIAQDLGVSETRINQHVRALKDFYSVDSLNELVECFRAEYGTNEEEPSDVGLEAATGFSESAYRKSQLAGAGFAREKSARVDPGEIILSDVMPLGGLSPWQMATEPRVVPGMLDGENAVLIRLAAIVAIAFGILAAVVLMVTTALTLSEAMDGKAQVPADYYQPAD
ncbi:hypothetical protein [Altererythrobacter sp. Z27]|uniref:hypothetical protein n=1 Tax=Altererythrobacter sp. Z27 TaxID=3461147 RepID=UPI00404469EA